LEHAQPPPSIIVAPPRSGGVPPPERRRTRALRVVGTPSAVKPVHYPVQAVQREAREAEDARIDGDDHQKNFDVVGHVSLSSTISLERSFGRPPGMLLPGARGHRYGRSRPQAITPAQHTSTRTATALAKTGASSPALTFHSRSDSEKYSTAVAPIGMNA